MTRQTKERTLLTLLDAALGLVALQFDRRKSSKKAFRSYQIYKSQVVRIQRKVSVA